MKKISLNEIFAPNVVVVNEGVLPENFISEEKNSDRNGSNIRLAVANTRHMTDTAVEIRDIYDKYPD